MIDKNGIKVNVKGGSIIAQECADINYPGIDIEYVSDRDNGENASRPRILFEFPKDGCLRALIWDDKDNEDYTREIEFDI